MLGFAEPAVAVGIGDAAGRVVVAHGTVSVGGEHGAEQWEFDVLADAVPLPRVQGHGDADDALEGGKSRGYGEGAV